MKFSLFFLPAFVASTLASPIEQLQDSDLTSILSTLQTSVKAHGAKMNESASHFTGSAGDWDKAVVATVDREIKALANSLHAASLSITIEKGVGNSQENKQMALKIFQDVSGTISEMPKNVLSKTNPPALAALANAMGDLSVLLTSLVEGMTKLLTQMAQTVVEVLAESVPEVLKSGGLLTPVEPGLFTPPPPGPTS